MNIIPQLNSQELDPDWELSRVNSVDHIRVSYGRLPKCKDFLVQLYNDEFLSNLVDNATNSKNRYKPVKHKELIVGDIVLIKEPLLKPK